MDKLAPVACLLTGIIIGFLAGGYKISQKHIAKGQIRCRTATEIILLHTKRERFVDKLQYPLHQLTTKEKLQLTDSINYYNTLLR